MSIARWGWWDGYKKITTQAILFVEEVLKEIEDQLGWPAIMANAYLCGFINGFIDMVNGILQLIVMVYKAGKLSTSSYHERLIAEFFDEMIPVLRKFDWIGFFRRGLKSWKGVKRFLVYLGEKKLKSITGPEWAYFFGYMYANITEMFIPYGAIASTTKGGEVVVKAGRIMDDIFQRLRAAGRKAVKEGKKALDVLLAVLDEVAKLMSEGVDAVMRYLERVVERLLEMLDGAALKKKPDTPLLEKGDDIDLKKNRGRELQELMNSRIKFRKSNYRIKRIEAGLSNSRSRMTKSTTGAIDWRKIKARWYHWPFVKNRIVKIEMGAEEALLLSRNRVGRVGQFTNVAKAEMEISYKGKRVFFKDDYWASANAKDLIPGGKGIGKPVEKVNKKLLKDTEFNPAKSRKWDSERKILTLMDESIAKVATELGVNEQFLTIRYKISSSYDPCNVCKMEILARVEYFKKCSFEVVRPVYIENGFKKIVKDHRTFEIYLSQNK